MAGVLCLAVLSLMCGYRSLSAIHRFGDTHPELWAHLELPRSPSVPTLSRLLRMVSVGELRQVLMRFALELALQRRCGVGVIAMDGKTMGGVWEGGESASGGRVLHLFSQESAVALDQMAVKEHLDEPRAAQAWIEQVAGRIEGLRVLTGDARYSDADLCQAIVDRGKDYVVKLKKLAPTVLGRRVALLRPWAAGARRSVPGPRSAGTAGGVGVGGTGDLCRLPRLDRRDQSASSGTGEPDRTVKGQRAVQGEQPVEPGAGPRVGPAAGTLGDRKPAVLRQG